MNPRTERLSLYDQVSRACSRATTRAYSTSFSWSIRTLASDIRPGIYAIYGFVRLADEVVDSFQGHDRADLLARLKEDTVRALDDRISTNPILQAFQETYHRYGIDRRHVDEFLRSMEWDLHLTRYGREHFDEYIVGSAEVVGLMCLKVFVRGDQLEYERLERPAARLGAAFQKVNFLRDLGEDTGELGRSYFPDFDLATFGDADKRRIEDEIEADLAAAREGIRQLPRDARFSVFAAFTLYSRLLKRIRRLTSRDILSTRVRVPDIEKLVFLAGASLRHRFNLV